MVFVGRRQALTAASRAHMFYTEMLADFASHFCIKDLFKTTIMLDFICGRSV